MTPPRMVELQCPKCRGRYWVIDSDFRGESGTDLPYEEREYACSTCSNRSVGHRVLQKSPPEFFLQPHRMYPMSQADFNYWHGILKQHFPDHPHLKDAGWRPGQR